MIYNAQPLVSIYHEICSVEIAMTQDARARRQLCGDVIEFSFEFGGFGVSKFFASQTSKVVLNEEVQFPGKFRFIKGETARD